MTFATWTCPCNQHAGGAWNPQGTLRAPACPFPTRTPRVITSLTSEHHRLVSLPLSFIEMNRSLWRLSCLSSFCPTLCWRDSSTSQTILIGVDYLTVYNAIFIYPINYWCYLGSFHLLVIINSATVHSDTSFSEHIYMHFCWYITQDYWSRLSQILLNRFLNWLLWSALPPAAYRSSNCLIPPFPDLFSFLIFSQFSYFNG